MLQTDESMCATERNDSGSINNMRQNVEENDNR